MSAGTTNYLETNASPHINSADANARYFWHVRCHRNTQATEKLDALRDEFHELHFLVVVLPALRHRQTTDLLTGNAGETRTHRQIAKLLDSSEVSCRHALHTLHRLLVFFSYLSDAGINGSLGIALSLRSFFLQRLYLGFCLVLDLL